MEFQAPKLRVAPLLTSATRAAGRGEGDVAREHVRRTGHLADAERGSARAREEVRGARRDDGRVDQLDGRAVEGCDVDARGRADEPRSDEATGVHPVLRCVESRVAHGPNRAAEPEEWALRVNALDDGARVEGAQGGHRARRDDVNPTDGRRVLDTDDRREYATDGRARGVDPGVAGPRAVDRHRVDARDPEPGGIDVGADDPDLVARRVIRLVDRALDGQAGRRRGRAQVRVAGARRALLHVVGRTLRRGRKRRSEDGDRQYRSPPRSHPRPIMPEDRTGRYRLLHCRTWRIVAR